MLLLPILLCFASEVVRSARFPISDGKIVGGRETTIEEYPHQVSLQVYGNHGCGGSIISENKVLTAAHCTDERSPKILSVRAGTSRRQEGGQIFEVAQICQHPWFNPVNIDNDISVLVLSSPIQFDLRSRPIGLQSKNTEISEGAFGTITGWGRTDENGSPSPQLRAARVPRVSDENCNRFYKNRIRASMICFGFAEGGKDACQGDSGGPLVVGNEQVGVVSWGYGCAQPHWPGVYAKVAFCETTSTIA